uniref:WSN domain-containing protein n=1 Tax=Steinernema glaseri TaxID=37863 RepID=A0A1I7ZJS7_9BILA
MSSALLLRLTLLLAIAFSLAVSSWSYVLKDTDSTDDLTDLEKIEMIVDRRSPNVNNLVSQMLEKLNDGGSNAMQVRRQMLSRKFWK